MTWAVQGLTVRFGRRIALDHVDMSIEPGAVHALIGGDGAGKSTLQRVLAGSNLGQTGLVRIPAADRIGFVPSRGGVFGDLTVDENLQFVAAAFRLRSWRPRADELMERVGLGQFGDRLAGRLSGGERRKLATSMAMLPTPDLLVLDEVTSGVDPVSRMELWRLVARAAAGGAAIVAATTYIDEAERADSVVLLHDGRVLAAGRPHDITAGVPGTIGDTDRPDDPVRAWRKGRRWRQWRPGAVRVAAEHVSLEDAAIVYELMAGGVR